MLGFLPREILHLILQNLDLEDLVRTDTATLNHIFRPYLLTALDGITIPIYDTSTNRNQLDWILRRNIIPLGFVLWKFNYEIECLLYNSFSQLKYLEFCECIFYSF
jgi:hypothetical protein